jgi:CheY-like chemotaxis protein
MIPKQTLYYWRAVLRDKGYATKTAKSAAHALENYHENMPGLILLDLMMPEINGQEMLARLKSNSLDQSYSCHYCICNY